MKIIVKERPPAHLQRTATDASHCPADAPSATARESPSDGRPFIVLCVEDNPVNVELIRATLALRDQVRLEVATDGQEGLEAAHRLQPDLVLLDMGLPVLDGLAVLAHLRADPTLARIPCVAVSANAMPSDIQQALDAGFNDYIVKPFAVASMLQLLDRIMAQSPQRATTSDSSILSPT
ncbi:MAG: response regulator [Burkholderiales bacterium]|nr:response regulator [Burkholderiales bacterium]